MKVAIIGNGNVGSALDHAIALSRATGAGLTVVHVRVDVPDYEDQYRSRVHEPGPPPRYDDLYADHLDASLAPVDDVLRRTVTIAAAWRAEVIALRVPNDGEVDRRPELAGATMAVIAYPSDETRMVSRSDANVRALLRSRLCPVLAIPVK